MEILKDTSVKAYNTFGIDAKTKYLVKINNTEAITKFIDSGLASENNTFILGGGSNILFTQDFPGVLIHSTIDTIELIDQDHEYVYIKCGSGVNWDTFVDYCVNKGWGGIENLSDIPGNIGATPVQNIGAYGVEAKDVIFKAEAINLINGETKEFSNADCRFAYRHSYFKEKGSENLFISHVTFRLTKKHTLITHYGNLEEELKKYSNPGIKELREIIVKTRQSKLPSTDKLGSAGSFFMNPVVPDSLAKDLLKAYPDMPQYKYTDTKKKLSAAWLIDHAGLKGTRHGDVGTYPNQALVIVNYGKASGKNIVEFSSFIQKTVSEKYGIELKPEVIFK